MPRRVAISTIPMLAAIAAGTLTEVSERDIETLSDELDEVEFDAGEPVFGHFYPGDKLRIRASANPALVGTTVEVVDDSFGSTDTVLVVRKPSGKRIAYNEDDLRANKLEHV